MNTEIHYRPGNSAARVDLAPGESFTAEGGAMIAMSGDMQIETTTHKKGKGSILKSLKRLLTGESLFLNHYTAGANGGHVWVAPTLSGDIEEVTLNQETLIVQGGSFLAAEPSIDMDMNWQGFQSMFSGESLFWISMKGSGKLLMNSFGTIYSVDVDGDFIVDTGHIVAFQETLSFKISKAGKSWISSFLGGEGLVCRFSGKGKLYCQSHNPSAFGAAMTPHLRPRRG